MSKPRFSEKELRLIAQDLEFRGVERERICQAHVTAVGLRLGKKDLLLGNRVGATKATTLSNLLDGYLN